MGNTVWCDMLSFALFAYNTTTVVNAESIRTTQCLTTSFRPCFTLKFIEKLCSHI